MKIQYETYVVAKNTARRNKETRHPLIKSQLTALN
jgi:hypothetical protein